VSKTPKSVKSVTILYGNTFRIPGPQTRKKTPTIYIYIKRVQKGGVSKLSFLGSKKGGSLNCKKGPKHQKYTLAGLLADNSQNDPPQKPSKTPFSVLLAENPKNSEKEVRGLPKTSKKCRNPLFNTKKHVDLFRQRRVHPKAF